MEMDSFPEARIIITGMGLAVARTAFGVNLVSAAYVSVRPVRGAKPATLGVFSMLTADGNSGSLVVGHAQTDWFKISKEAYIALLPQNVVGKSYLLDLEISNTLLESGRCDISATLIGSGYDGAEIINAYNVPTKGAQISGTSIRGAIRPVQATPSI